MTKLAAYLRVSTEGQAEDGYGLELQRDAIVRWAKRNGHRITVWCSDAGVSGSLDALEREGLACALGAIESGRAAGLVVAKLDRLARRLTVQEAALALVWRAGGSDFSVDAGEITTDDPDDPMRTAMRQMMGVFAELERATITKRMRDGRRAKQERGGYAGGAPPLGYRAEGKALVPCDEEADTVRRILELRAGGASYRQIAAALEAEGRRTKRGAAKWHNHTISRIVERQGGGRSVAGGQ